MLTYAIHYNNMWFNDNEFWEEGDLVESSCEKLAAAWKKLLAHSDKELGIDPLGKPRPAGRRQRVTERLATAAGTRGIQRRIEMARERSI